MVRLKARYVLFEILYPGNARLQYRGTTDSKAFMRELRGAIETYFGEYGSGQCQNMLGLRFYNPTTGLGILRVGRGQERIVQAALTMIREIGGLPVLVRIRHVSGTVAKSQEHALEISTEELRAL